MCGGVSMCESPSEFSSFIISLEVPHGGTRSAVGAVRGGSKTKSGFFVRVVDLPWCDLSF